SRSLNHTNLIISMGPDPRRRTYKTRDEARQDVFDYIEMFYNPVRKQVRNGMLSPAQFERQQMLKAEGV
ncbi:IS3 family transposase, partial [Sphingobium yanoikuyae]|uniref:IS3 family transposase n=1 Tax=Sphingobium yanoikuyae TaxID=13690 RepID=UPI002FDD0C9F